MIKGRINWNSDREVRLPLKDGKSVEDQLFFTLTFCGKKDDETASDRKNKLPCIFSTGMPEFVAFETTGHRHFVF
ncbi:MAG: hypothetical protein FJ240_12635 [Nitrospira sp.]|nr:hypothetical protein [Nitrospira sp.]